ncbi:unnamed protein product [Caenorhabditis nigoni]
MKNCVGLSDQQIYYTGTLAVPDVPLKKTPNENSYKDEKESCETKGDTEEEKTSNDEDSKLNMSADLQ